MGHRSLLATSFVCHKIKAKSESDVSNIIFRIRSYPLYETSLNNRLYSLDLLGVPLEDKIVKINT